MRKLILIIALTMVPLGIWTAGCRNDQQAAFPDTPEMKSLAGSGDDRVSEVAVAPMIPAKPIDREILHYPDNGTLARVQAVRDRANQYASEKAGHGLFTLPEEDNYLASAPAMRRNSGNGSRDSLSKSETSGIAVPAPSAREFWSKPVAERNSDGNRPRQGLPEDISAMAGPARVDEGVLLLPPPTRAPSRAARDMLILPPDDLPGVFMVGEADEPPGAPPPARGWFGMLRNDGGDALGAPPLSSRAGGTPVASLPTPSAPQSRSRSLERRLLSAAGARPRAEMTQRAPMVLDIDNLVGGGADAGMTASAVSARRSVLPSPEAFPPIAPGARIVSSEGMDFEPLPEPIPLSQYNSMVMDELAAGVPGVSGAANVSRRETSLPSSIPAVSAPAAKRTETLSAPILPLPAALLRGSGESALKAVPAPAPAASRKAAPAFIPVAAPAAASVSAPAIPELTEVKLSPKIPDAERFAKVEKALEPLPVLIAPASPASAPAPAKPRQEKVVVALPAPMPDPLPTPEAAAAQAALLEFSPEAMDEAFAELNKNDYFKTDFWEPAAKTQMRMEVEPSLPVLPELSEPAAPDELMIPMPPPLLEEPRKIVLQPILKGRVLSEMEAIDSAMDAPPLKF